MTALRRFLTGAGPRGTPAARRAVTRHPVVLLAVALVALTETGCQSGLCGQCGPTQTGWRSFRDRMSRPFRGSSAPASACCGPEIGGVSTPLPYGSPTIINPPPTATVSPSPTDSLPSTLEPIPSATPGPPPSGGSGDATPREGSKSQAGKANYEAYRSRYGPDSGRGDSLARSNPKATSPEPTSRSAQGSAPSKESETSALDNLPPLDIPRDPSQARADDTPSPGGLPAPAPEVSVAPGLRRFSGVGAKLAAGSAPSAAGLDWLVEKGYRTVLDLREGTELSPAFIADVSRRGLRYVALPITAATVDADHVSRFESELALTDARPLYFFDTDGTRAGVLWFIHRVQVDKVDAETARRDAEEIGLTDPAFLKAAQSYLDSRKPPTVPTPAPAPTPAVTNPPTPAPAPAPAGNPATPAAGAGAKPAVAPPANGPGTPPASASPAPGAAVDLPPTPRDPTAWRPVAAMIVTGLGVPLAYVSRTAMPSTFRALTRASLPAPVRTVRSLPDGSGART